MIGGMHCALVSIERTLVAPRPCYIATYRDNLVSTSN